MKITHVVLAAILALTPLQGKAQEALDAPPVVAITLFAFHQNHLPAGTRVWINKGDVGCAWANNPKPPRVEDSCFEQDYVLGTVAKIDHDHAGRLAYFVERPNYDNTFTFVKTVPLGQAFEVINLAHVWAQHSVYVLRGNY